MNLIERKITQFPEFFGLFALFIVEVPWTRIARLTVLGFSPVIVCVTGLLIISYLYRRSNRSRALSEMAYYAAAMVLSGVCNLLLSYLVARWSFSLKDAQFAAADVALGLSLPNWFLFLGKYHTFDDLLKVAYASLILQFSFSIIYFAHAARAGRNKEMFWIVAMSSLLTATISGLLPALGAFSHFHLSPDRATHLAHLTQLRHPGEMVIRLTQLEGIITLPSYHAVLALVFIYLHRGNRVTFLLVLMLNLLVLLSTPTYGGHYFVDMIAGAAVAVSSIYLVRQWGQIQLRESPKSHLDRSLHREA